MAEPDIAFCVDVYNIATGLMTKIHLICNCSVYEPHYIFWVQGYPNLRNLFMFIVTPRSNVEGALNGTLSSINGSFHIQSELLWILYIYGYMCTYMYILNSTLTIRLLIISHVHTGPLLLRVLKVAVLVSILTESESLAHEVARVTLLFESMVSVANIRKFS